MERDAWQWRHRRWRRAQRWPRGGRPPFPFFWGFFAVAWLIAGWWHSAGRVSWQPAVFFVLALGSAIFAYVTARFTRRLDRLRRATEQINLRDLSVRVDVEGGDSVAALAMSFNRMVDRLAAEERSRRQLFADVAHEIRHPLAVLKGRIESIQDGVLPMDSEQVLLLHDAVIGLTRLVGDLRDLSLVDVGQLSLHLSEVDVAGLLQQLRESLDPVAEDKGITLTDTAHGMPTLRADADRLRQVMLNLLTNALHYTPSDGRVDVTARAVGAQAILEVSDTGSGIDPESLPHIFERFYRADKARARESGGTGLGLAIVRSLVELHGGDVTAVSSPAGSRFTVRLPLHGPRP
ncbi:MAG: ATP-binding protein [Thermaerobacter sp.]|nr:ATP-binding protein [Thermaerobacter sp.]